MTTLTPERCESAYNMTVAEQRELCRLARGYLRLRRLAKRVVQWDWSDNDRDAVADIIALGKDVK